MQGLLGNPVLQGLLSAGPEQIRAAEQARIAQMLPRASGGMMGAPSAPQGGGGYASAIGDIGGGIADAIKSYGAKKKAEEETAKETEVFKSFISQMPTEQQQKMAPLLGSESGRTILRSVVAKSFGDRKPTTKDQTALFDVNGVPKRMTLDAGMAEGLPEWQDAPDMKTFGSDATGYYTVGPNGVVTQLVKGLGRDPKNVQTVTIAKGVFVVNPDGTLGKQLGDAPARPQDDLATAKLTEMQEGAARQATNNYEDISKTIRQAELVLSHPGREAGTGMSSWSSMVPGSDARGFAAQLETLKSQVFLPEVQKMQGMGALSNAEGAKISAAFAALDPSMGDEEFKSSLQTAIGDLRRAQERARGKLPEGYADPFSSSGNSSEINVLIDKYAGTE